MGGQASVGMVSIIMQILFMKSNGRIKLSFMTENKRRAERNTPLEFCRNSAAKIVYNVAKEFDTDTTFEYVR